MLFLYDKETLFIFSNIIWRLVFIEIFLPDPHFSLVFLARTINGSIFHNVFLILEKLFLKKTLKYCTNVCCRWCGSVNVFSSFLFIIINRLRSDITKSFESLISVWRLKCGWKERAVRWCIFIRHRPPSSFFFEYENCHSTS